VEDGADALAYARTGDVQILVLDLGLPDVDGLSVLQRIRETNRSLPVVILTARSGVEHTVAGFEGGADDYVAKPFKFEELLARVRARLRTDRGPESSVLTVGDCALDLRTRRLAVRGSVVELSAREFALAELFFTHPGRYSPASCFSAGSGDTITIRARTSWTCTSDIFARSSVLNGSKPSEEWAIVWSPKPAAAPEQAPHQTKASRGRFGTAATAQERRCVGRT
jgi:CheY-like chemotaxis protein